MENFVFNFLILNINYKYETLHGFSITNTLENL